MEGPGPGMTEYRVRWLKDVPDLLGLSDLHQLRGRIGRSERKAHAYFLVPRKPLPASSRKLSTVFGASSGYRAMRISPWPSISPCGASSPRFWWTPSTRW